MGSEMCIRDRAEMFAKGIKVKEGNDVDITAAYDAGDDADIVF